MLCLLPQQPPSYEGSWDNGLRGLVGPRAPTRLDEEPACGAFVDDPACKRKTGGGFSAVVPTFLGGGATADFLIRGAADFALACREEAALGAVDFLA